MCSNCNSNGNRRNKVSLRTICIKNVKFKIVKIRTGCQNIGCFYYSESLHWAAQNSRLGRGLDIAGLNQTNKLLQSTIVIKAWYVFVFSVCYSEIGRAIFLIASWSQSKFNFFVAIKKENSTACAYKCAKTWIAHIDLLLIVNFIVYFMYSVCHVFFHFRSLKLVHYSENCVFCFSVTNRT